MSVTKRLLSALLANQSMKLEAQEVFDEEYKKRHEEAKVSLSEAAKRARDKAERR